MASAPQPPQPPQPPPPDYNPTHYPWRDWILGTYTPLLRPRLSIYAVMGAVMDILNRIDDEGMLIPEDSPDVLSGLRADLIPKFFDEALNMLCAQPVDPSAVPPRVISFTARLPGGGHPFHDRGWVREVLHIPNVVVNRLLRNRLRARLAARINAGTMPVWYPFEKIRL